MKIIFIIPKRKEIMKKKSSSITGTADAFDTKPSFFFVYLCYEKMVQ